MVPRILATLAALMIAVVTAVSSAHAVQMGASHDHPSHVANMMPGAEIDAHSCAGEGPCGAEAATLCDVLCAGMPAMLTGSDTAAGADAFHERHAMPSASTLVGQLPALTEHPPKRRLP